MRVKISPLEQRARVSLALLSLRKEGDNSLSSCGSVSADQPALQTAQALPKPRLDHWYIQVTGFQCLGSRLGFNTDFGRPPKILRLTFPLIFCSYI